MIGAGVGAGAGAGKGEGRGGLTFLLIFELLYNPINDKKVFISISKYELVMYKNLLMSCNILMY